MDKLNSSNVVVYTDGELELKASLNDETIWLTQKQLGELFKVTKQNVSLHVNRVFQEEELDKNSTVKFFLTVQKEGNRTVERNLEHYNLDMIISIGYRVNSKKATKFRQWATSVLKSYIQNGYVINAEKITNQRFKELENDVEVLKSKVKKISSSLENKTQKPDEGIFFDGQVYDVYAFLNDLLKSAKSEIVLIDNYIDDTLFTLFSKYPKLKIKIYTQTVTKQLRLDYQKYQAQYKNIELQEFKSAHDRFMIIDETEIYHIGASLKDLGKKWFAFSKFESGALDILKKLH
ncbi:RhuM family protein [Sulfurimonas sp.]|uniref:RhuM family protein n=1 Tax=Sulfurimonas sp. TaxID=2022749 RepID=UPI00286D96FE|nr:RhuM family protein [Sulfurimonas sp.]